jgi:hypothetical protein
MKGHQREASYATQEHGHKEILFKVEQHAAQTVKSNFPYHIVNILAFQKKKHSKYFMQNLLSKFST